ncbi:MAG: Gfo/Idh/MocA family oxidoreductase [Rhodospirillales bacterium]|nr:Gfo/Idh/MocA family oxidoreductase [Rhodospirillales bacterium]
MSASKALNSTSPLQLGFIGGGLSSSIGPSHFSASQLDGRWQLVAGFFSRSKETSAATATAWNIDQNRAYDSWQDFIVAEKDKLDAVAVLTPTPEHTDILVELLRNKIPIICEKPMVASLEEARTIEQAFQSSPGFLAVTYNYSGYPMVRELKERVKNGELGEVIKVHFEMPQEVFMRVDATTGEPMKPQSWRLEDGSIPVICLDLGVHLHHLADFITGKKALRTAGEFSNHSTHKGLVDDIMMWLEYEGGMKGSFWMSKTALGHRNGLKLRIYGTKGSAEWLQSEPEEMRMSYKDGSRTIVDRAAGVTVSNEPRYNRYRAGHPSGFIEAFANLYSDIADALIAYSDTGKQENPYVFGLDHSIEGLELFTAAIKANDSGRWENLNDPAPRDKK